MKNNKLKQRFGKGLVFVYLGLVLELCCALCVLLVFFVFLHFIHLKRPKIPPKGEGGLMIYLAFFLDKTGRCL